LRWSVDTHQLPIKALDSDNRRIDANSLPCAIGIFSANDDPIVQRLTTMEPDEVVPIDREEDTPLGNREGEYILVSNPLVVAPCLACCENIMAEAAESFYNGPREIFVRIEACHRSRLILFTDRLLDFLLVTGDIEPGIEEIDWTQRRKVV
jgi:hypothetical protein